MAGSYAVRRFCAARELRAKSSDKTVDSACARVHDVCVRAEAHVQARHLPFRYTHTCARTEIAFEALQALCLAHAPGLPSFF